MLFILPPGRARLQLCEGKSCPLFLVAWLCNNAIRSSYFELLFLSFKNFTS